MNRILRYARIVSSLLSAALLVFALWGWRIAAGSGAYAISRGSPGGRITLIIYDRQFILEEWDTPEQRVTWASWNSRPGDGLAAEMGLGPPVKMLPGFAISPWTHFPAAGDFRLAIISPIWPVVLFAILPMAEMFIAIRRAGRRLRCAKPGLCANCRYDLRAHKAGDRCPECGNVISSASGTPA